MTDNLRTRIAKVLYRCDYDLRDWDAATDIGRQPYYDDADAVIRELGLRQERKRHTHPSQYRYVTEWTTTDE